MPSRNFQRLTQPFLSEPWQELKGFGGRVFLANVCFGSKAAVRK